MGSNLSPTSRSSRRLSLSVLLALSMAATLYSCGDEAEDESTSGATGDPGQEGTVGVQDEAPSGPLLEESGALADDDPLDRRGRFDRYFVDVGANERILVSLTSANFDPVLEVTPPQSGGLFNDDWQGDRTRSQLEFLSPAAGAIKIEVRSYGASGSGEYDLTVRRIDGEAAADEAHAGVHVPVLQVGASVEGELSADDHHLSSGERFDSFVIRGEGRLRVAVSALEGSSVPTTTLVGSDGRALAADEGVHEVRAAGSSRLQVIGQPGIRYRVQVQPSAAPSGGVAPLLARAHHRFNEILGQLAGTRRQPAPRNTTPATTPVAQPSAPAAASIRMLPIRLGDRLHGNLADNDPTLPSGERYDVYTLELGPGVDETMIEMESSGLDSFLRVEGPGGLQLENDDFGGTRNARVVLPVNTPGTYRIVATSFRAGETGLYELKVQTLRSAPQATPTGPANAVGADPGAESTIAGELAEGDRTLSGGEFADAHSFEWQAGQRIHLEARSTDFDSYLIIRSPSGNQQDNDDMTPGQGLNAGLDLQVTEAGTWRVTVTSYRPGEGGAYTLITRGGGAPQPGTAPPATDGTPPTADGPNPAPAVAQGGTQEREGSLAQGDTTLSSGEFTDTYTLSFTPRSAVSIRLESDDFDSYLILRSPSGHQEDNDDLRSGVLHAGIDIPVAEPGAYQVTVTSYRPGERGSYRLITSEGPSVVGSPPAPGAPAGSGSGGRIWGLFAGITDYPGGTNDLPECANDAVKLAEALRAQGDMPTDQEFLLTDNRATTENIRNAMTTIASRIQPEDVFVFFYSGHGGQTEHSSDERELDGRDEYLFVYDGRLMDDELGRLFDGIHARVALVAIDACFAGGFAKDVITQPGRVGMFSSEEDVTSAVAGGFQAGGYLSHFLRLGISGEADNDPNNHILTVGELTHYTWRQFGTHASDVRMSMGYQHLVVDRGAVHTTEVLWAVR